MLVQENIKKQSKNSQKTTSLDLDGAPMIRLEPSKGWVSLKLRELWEYRELLYFLTWRDIKVRYKQSLLGAGWAILQPLLTMIIFTVFFGRWAGIPTDDVPQPVFYFVRNREQADF